MPKHGRARAGSVSRVVALAVAISLFSGVLMARASGVTLACGSVVSATIKLAADVGPCPDGGVVVTASHITVDLGGHRIFGGTSVLDGIGIRLQNVIGTTVKNGTVSNFDAGIQILGGANNTINKVKALENVGQSGVTILGDGIVIDGSPNNVVQDSEVRSNGPFSGISVLGGASAGNKLTRNTVQHNDLDSMSTLNTDVGIRLEAETRETTLKQNVVTYSGLDGITLFQGTRNNLLIENTVKFNGFHNKAHRRGDGIRVFGDAAPEANVLKSNVAQDNAGNGVIVSLNATENTVSRTKAGRNGGGIAGATDLTDANPGCDSNTWTKNSGSKSQTCIH